MKSKTLFAKNDSLHNNQPTSFYMVKPRSFPYGACLGKQTHCIILDMLYKLASHAPPTLESHDHTMKMCPCKTLANPMQNP